MGVRPFASPIILSAVFLASTACQANEPSGVESVLEAGLETAPVPSLKTEPSEVLRAPDVTPIIETAAASSGLTCEGVFEQGGAALCKTSPNAKVKIARSEKDFYYENADASGNIIVGFDRDEADNFIEADGQRVVFDIEAREYSISRIDGLPPSQVSTYTQSQLDHIRASTAKKSVGFASREQTTWLTNGFSYPLKDFVKTSPFGSQRILNGEPKSPHYGVDIAAPIGTPIYAPAPGVVSLADADLYFEGAMVMIDHGQGLNSMYLHVSEIFVSDGDIVEEGQKIAAVGNEGRSTGPHLCWRLKWRNRNLDPEVLTRWPGRE